ncbi:hypothetical protein ETD86_23690 [Nonomuraea turkmeniaca]|uniref:Uncharacterized protein n=1 Tax=Nonomuraea turkmeniaca TaxID=103838 RepID=A0A5S4FEL2_9ACTN|nr:hypothetical protein ETD86_23690 [Nonomuraea turkmeniaca]
MKFRANAQPFSTPSRHAAQWGADPTRTAVFGESCGAMPYACRGRPGGRPRAPGRAVGQRLLRVHPEVHSSKLGIPGRRSHRTDVRCSRLLPDGH